MEADGNKTESEPVEKQPIIQTSASKTLAMFREIATQLDEKYDKLERIIKLSRDVTIESKRIIFLLHRASSDPNALIKAARNLHVTRERLIHKIAVELEGADKYYFIRCFTPGLQEYIEAFAFYRFLKDGTLLSFEEMQNDILTFTVYCDTGHQASGDKKSRSFDSGPGRPRRSETIVQSTEAKPDVPAAPVLQESQSQCEVNIQPSKPSGDTKIISIYLPQVEFVLGLSDVPGELMRSCVLAVAQGDEAFAFMTCKLVQHFYKGCIGLSYVRREMLNKIRTLKASVEKMEYSCYSLIIRGTNKAKPSFFENMLDDSWNHNGEDYDSGND